MARHRLPGHKGRFLTGSGRVLIVQVILPTQCDVARRAPQLQGDGILGGADRPPQEPQLPRQELFHSGTYSPLKLDAPR